MEMLERGNHNRTQHPTDANHESSRSHAVFQVDHRHMFLSEANFLLYTLHYTNSLIHYLVSGVPEGPRQESKQPEPEYVALEALAHRSGRLGARDGHCEPRSPHARGREHQSLSSRSRQLHQRIGQRTSVLDHYHHASLLYFNELMRFIQR